MRRLSVFLASLLFVLACSDDGEGDGPDPVDDAATDTGAPSGEVGDARVQMLDAGAPLDASVGQQDAAPLIDAGPLREVPCVDEQFARLMLFDVPSIGEVRAESATGGVFQTFIDAQAGGVMTNQGFVYGRFTSSGLERVSISDEAAFASRDWDIAFRRYVIRLNSGVGGPGNITAARTAPGTTFAGLTSLSSDLTYRSEAYYTESCEYVADVGIGAPSTVLSSFWEYGSCLKMTHNVYVIALASGRHVKLEVLSYYPPDNQKLCDETGQFALPSGAGQLRIKWAFVD